ncbi:MAG: SUMF1/EgtB/PvdO family nonheme iron enzyme [Balneolales bacterium]|nr:SUMF1/EgtB/PvdO family nonheme iron enzyme [Balneolales bacterium]
MKKLFSLFILLFVCHAAKANDIRVSNGTLGEQNTAEGYRIIEFDLSWENSWRTDNLFPDDGHSAGNWDAAWVFIKYSADFGQWRHAKLHYSGHSTGAGTPATLDIGVPNEREAFHISDNPGVGAFIYRSEEGSGTFSTTGNKLRWNYAIDGVADDAYITIRIFAIEMVYVAPGPFWLGSGATETGSFFAGGETGSTPFLVTENWNGCIQNIAGCLWGNSTTGNSTIGGPGSLNPDFPTGIDGFYSMKYSVSQQQYVDFLNTLTPSQATARAYTGGAFRNGISLSDGRYQTSNPFVSNNFMTWMDGAAFADWAGLRPMTETEFEKAARGPAAPVPGEYAWGNTSAVRATGLANAGQPNETATPENANVNFMVGATPAFGPIRVGAFAFGSTTREASGAGYWGIMELSGNMWERPVTVGQDRGRAFTGLHGDGTLHPSGNGRVENWPGNGANGIGGAIGSGFRGGSLNDQQIELSVSRRFSASIADESRFQNYGFRGVRSLPSAVMNP